VPFSPSRSHRHRALVIDTSELSKADGADRTRANEPAPTHLQRDRNASSAWVSKMDFAAEQTFDRGFEIKTRAKASAKADNSRIFQPAVNTVSASTANARGAVCRRLFVPVRIFALQRFTQLATPAA
jgi:hypothetical protein